MKLTKNISREELYCKCTYADCDMKKPLPTHQLLAEQLQDGVDHFATVMGHPVYIRINCCNRCKRHNFDVGGEDKSKHMEGIAADIVLYVDGGSRIAPSLVAEYFERKYKTTHGIGRYKTFTHFDTRENKARWSHE